MTTIIMYMYKNWQAYPALKDTCSNGVIIDESLSTESQCCKCYGNTI